MLLPKIYIKSNTYEPLYILTTPYKMAKLCLNMIVKNESRIIERLLTSVLPLIDSYCICDTGSTDNTIELIETFFQRHKIAGRIVKEPFCDFGYNRTFALNACLGLPNADYLLLLDADMKLRISPDLDIRQFKESLCKDAYYVFQGSDLFFYKNVRILRNDPEYSYWGVTHEYIKTTPNSVYENIERSTLFIDDIGDGGAKADKFERDIRLLLKGLEEHPNNYRYTFYLANSYRDAKRYKESIQCYEERTKLGGWHEEIWYSYYSIGKCYEFMGDMPNAIHAWLQAYQFLPVRIEPLYKIVNYYRCQNKNVLSYAFYEMARQEMKKDMSQDHLFLEKEVYDFKLEYEFTILAYYRNPENRDVVASCMNILSHPHAMEDITKNILSNYKFYSPCLHNLKTQSHDENIRMLNTIGTLGTVGTVGKVTVSIDSSFYNSTPSICWDPTNPSKLIVCLRYVNYRIDEHGEYVNQANIISKNVIAYIDTSKETWQLTDQVELKHNSDYDDLYIGIEDVRIMPYQGKLLFNGNRGISSGRMTVEHGSINLVSRSTLSYLLETDGQYSIEKNWILFENAERQLKCVYNWYPLKIGNIINHPESKIDDKKNPVNKLVITHEQSTPNFFRWLRGSTNGQRISDEIWFICHLVSYEDRRFYYHIFVALDCKTMELKRFSRIFTFEKEKVEYTLGFVFLEKSQELLIGYSLLDKETKYLTIHKDKIEDLFII
jgi:tetratricopeptide (TPR) repeat protein